MRQKLKNGHLSTGAIARHCGVSKVTVLRWIDKGELKAFQLPSGQNRVHRDDFQAFIKKYGIPVMKEDATE